MLGGLLVGFKVAPQFPGPCECHITFLTNVGCPFIVGGFSFVGYAFFAGYVDSIVFFGCLSVIRFRVTFMSYIINRTTQ